MNNQSKKQKVATCEIEVALAVIGGKWKPLILWFLGEAKVLRFSEFQHLIPNITHKILTSQLRELENNELIERKVYAEVPPRVEYSITDRGKEVLPIFDTLCTWACKNDEFGYELTNNLCSEDTDKKII